VPAPQPNEQVARQYLGEEFFIRYHFLLNIPKTRRTRCRPATFWIAGFQHKLHKGIVGCNHDAVAIGRFTHGKGAGAQLGGEQATSSATF